MPNLCQAQKLFANDPRLCWKQSTWQDLARAQEQEYYPLYFLNSISYGDKSFISLVLGDKGLNVIALFAEQTFDSESLIRPIKLSRSQNLKSLIQFWTVGKTQTGIESAKFSMAIAHDFGRVQSLQWCPSGGQAEAEGKLPRLGILAAGCEDGTVRIFSLPELSSVPNLDPNNPERNIFKSGAIITLRRPEMEDDDLFSPCMKVAWFRGRRHRVIAASFAGKTKQICHGAL